jgi:hypothetical protein
MFQELISFSSIATGLLGLFVIVILTYSYKSNELVNIHLVIIFFVISFRFIANGIFQIYNLVAFDFNVLKPFYLLIIPSFYLYFKSLSKDYKLLHHKDLYHTIFPFTMVFLTFGQEYFSFLNNRSVSLVQFISVIVFIAFYLGKSFYVIYRDLWKRNNLPNGLDKRHNLIKKWVVFIFILISLLSFRLLSSLIVEKTSNLQWSGTTFSIFANVLWIIIFGKILSSPEILYGIPKLEERVSNYMNEIKINHSLWNLFTPEVKNLQDSNLKSIIHTKIEVYISDIEYFICDTHPFRDPNLSFKDIAGELNIPISHLAYVFKYHCKVSYVE